MMPADHGGDHPTHQTPVEELPRPDDMDARAVGVVIPDPGSRSSVVMIGGCPCLSVNACEN